MSLTVSDITFEGPFSSSDDLEDRSGVYLIVDQVDGETLLIDCGESAQMRTRVASHDRSECWQRNGRGRLSVAVHYTPGLQQDGRRQIESRLRSRYSVPCGVR